MKTTLNKNGNQRHESEHLINGRKCLIQMGEGIGAKIHIFNEEGTKVVKTFRYNFVSVDKLKKRATEFINSKNVQP